MTVLRMSSSGHNFLGRNYYGIKLIYATYIKKYNDTFKFAQFHT